MQTKINEIKTKDQLIDYISKLMYTNENKVLTWNDDYMIESLKTILYNSGFEIQNAYYKTLSEAFDEIIYYLKTNDINTLNDFYENHIPEADIYTCDLLTWLNESLVYSSYCDEVILTHNPKSLIKILQLAQQQFKTEVYNMAFEIVEEIIKESQIVREGV